MYVLDTSGGVKGVIVLDPNGLVDGRPPTTPTGPFGAITITKPKSGPNPAMTGSSAFRVAPGSTLGQLDFGCNLLLTDTRFVEFGPGQPGLTLGGPPPFSNWLPDDVTVKVFGQVGSTVDLTQFPGIAAVRSQRCVPFPKKDEALEFLPLGPLFDLVRVKPLPPAYPNRTIPGSPPPDQQWFPGLRVLEVDIGFWR